MKTKFKISILVIVALSLSISTSWSAKRTSEKPSTTPKVVVTNPSATAKPSHVIGVIVSTKNPNVGQRVKVTVTGNPNYGDCLINLSKGDGTPIYFYGNSKSFPYTASNKNLWPKYDKPGTYTLNIMGNTSSSCKCSGNASVTITVKGVAKDIKSTNSSYKPPILLNLISPMNDAQWVLGREYKIKWSSTNLTGKVQLELVRYNGPMIGIIAKYLPASGSYQWTKAGEYIGHTAQPGKYLIRVRSMTKFECFDEGDPFKLIRLVKIISLVPPPVIEWVLPVPLGAITPGTRLFIGGKNFNHQPVEILMYGNFGGPGYNIISLINVNVESSTKVNGVVPIFSKRGHLDQTVEIRVKNGKGSRSNPWKVKFVGRKEQKVVLRNDVVVSHCGADGNINVCNGVVHKDPDPNQTWTMSPNTISISSYHVNKWGTVGYDKGYDKYKINLKNGWKFKSLQKVVWKKSSGDEKLSGPYPSFPEGESNWTPKINWEVSPNDIVKYHFIIIAEGPLGTHYK